MNWGELGSAVGQLQFPGGRAMSRARLLLVTRADYQQFVGGGQGCCPTTYGHRPAPADHLVWPWGPSTSTPETKAKPETAEPWGRLHRALDSRQLGGREDTQARQQEASTRQTGPRERVCGRRGPSPQPGGRGCFSPRLRQPLVTDPSLAWDVSARALPEERGGQAHHGARLGPRVPRRRRRHARTVDWEGDEEPARVGGDASRWNMASLHRNSRMLERSTLRPSACLRSSTEVTAGHQQHMAQLQAKGTGGKPRYRLLKPAQGQLWRHHGASLF